MPESIQQSFIIIVLLIGAIATLVGIFFLMDYASPVWVRINYMQETDKSMAVGLPKDAMMRTRIVPVTEQKLCVTQKTTKGEIKLCTSNYSPHLFS